MGVAKDESLGKYRIFDLYPASLQRKELKSILLRVYTATNFFDFQIGFLRILFIDTFTLFPNSHLTCKSFETQLFYAEKTAKLFDCLGSHNYINFAMLLSFLLPGLLRGKVVCHISNAILVKNIISRNLSRKDIT